jgi:hypothetical protein
MAIFVVKVAVAAASSRRRVCCSFARFCRQFELKAGWRFTAAGGATVAERSAKIALPSSAAWRAGFAKAVRILDLFEISHCILLDQID